MYDVGKSVDTNGPDTLQIYRPLFGTVCYPVERRFALVEEVATEPSPSLVVPLRRVFKILDNFWAKAKNECHLSFVAHVEFFHYLFPGEQILGMCFVRGKPPLKFFALFS